MKLNKRFTTCYLLAFNALYHTHTFINLSPYLYFPFPTESRNKINRTTDVVQFILYGDEPLRACSHKDQRRTKKRHLRQQDADLLCFR